jgi:drug/metabolite transporter (DMT)-like permease
MARKKWSRPSFRGGIELCFWKGPGTFFIGNFFLVYMTKKIGFLSHTRSSRKGAACHIYGVALTTANHGAVLLQSTALIVPVMKGLRGAEMIPRQIQAAVGLAWTGIYLLTQDPTKASEIASDPSAIQMGDALVLGAAFFYSI